jgi:Domain of unknown function (DUF4157)
MTKERTYASTPKQPENKPKAAAPKRAPEHKSIRRQTASRKRISQRGDALEQEAERIAAQLGMQPTPGSPLTLRGRAQLALPPLADIPPSVERTVRSPGQPLQLPIRALMESRFRQDFSGVQVHTDSPAQQSARDVDARAYTVGEHVVFGHGQYDPVSTRGQRLIADELTHVVQQSAGKPIIQRNGDDEELLASTNPIETLAASFDPAAVDVESFTNRELLDEYARVREAITTNTGVEREAYTRLRDRLAEERTRRVNLGHEWLEDAGEFTPSTLYRIVHLGGDTEIVLNADPTEAMREPTDLEGERLMTPRQFTTMREQEGIPSISGRAAAVGIAASRVFIPARDLALESAFSRPTSRWGWAGPFAENAQFYSQPRGTYFDLNTMGWVNSQGQAQRGNFPVLDLRNSQWTQGEQITTSMSAIPQRRLDWYMRHHAEMLGMDTTRRRLSRTRVDVSGERLPFDPALDSSPAYDSFVQNLPSGVDPDALVSSSTYRVSPEEIAPLQSIYTDPQGQLNPNSPLRNYQRIPVCRVYTGIMRRASTPETVTNAQGTFTFRSVEQLETALKAHQINQAEFDAVLSRVGQRAAVQVAPHPESRASLEAWSELASRSDPASLCLFGPGEAITAQRLGLGRSMRSAAGRGAGSGAIIAVVTG